MSIPSSVNYKEVALFFDFDQTLFQVTPTRDSNPTLHLSKSTCQVDLSKSHSEGSVDNAPLLRWTENGITHVACATNVKAIARQFYKSFFLRINRINSRAPKPLIHVNILTNGAYTEGEVRSLMKRIYVFSIEYYYNRFRDFEDKGLQMMLEYGEHYSDLRLKDVYLIDDSEKNYTDATHTGFSSIHFCTNPELRPRDTSYSKERDAIFARMNAILDEVEAQLDSDQTASKAPELSLSDLP